MSAIDHLFVIWGEPTKGGRHVIGQLDRRAGGFHFWYEADLSQAFECGFSLLPEFPKHRVADDPYVERYLFPLFAERVPGAARSDAREILRQWGVERGDDQFEVLAKSGGVRATDRLELAEYRTSEDDLTRPLEFRVAGRRHIVDAAPLAAGVHVRFVTEPTNPADPGAVIVDRDGRRAGYVPKHYTALFGRLLADSVPLVGEVVRQLLVPDDVGKWVVRVARSDRSQL